MKTIIFIDAAAKEFDALPSRDREAVLDALSNYAMTGDGDIMRLSGRAGFRMRVGAYRILLRKA